MFNTEPKVLPKDAEVTCTLVGKAGGYVYGTGSLVDMAAYAHKLPSADSVWESSCDYAADCVQGAWKENAREWIVEALNGMTPGDAAAVVIPLLPEQCSLGLKFVQSPYLPGDCLDITRGDILDGIVSAFDASPVCDGEVAWLAKAAERLQEVEGDVYAEAHKEWLRGDRRGWHGIEKELARAIFGKYTDASITVDEKLDELTMTATAEEWADFLGLDWSCDTELDGDTALMVPTSVSIASSALETLDYLAQGIAKEEKRKREERAAQWKIEQARKEANAKADEDKKIADALARKAGKVC